MTDLCRGPDPHPRRPCFAVPAGAVDSHLHLLGPQSQLVAEREYTPPEIGLDLARHLLATLGIARFVVIQPSIYGFDNRAQLEAAAAIGLPFRAVVVVPHDTSDRELMRLNQQGARALRFILAHPGGLSLEGLARQAARVKEMGWHVQFLAKGPQLVELEPRIAALPCDAVIDHMGMIQPGAGLDQPAFQALLRLLRRGAWVKLSGAYRLSAQPPPYRDLAPFVREIVATRPDRLLWASDWPHVFLKGKMPNTTDLIDVLADWVPDAETRRRILVDNPAALFGF
ncbi:MAG: amidohydrolase family protein [Hyphomicrobiales bacterium]|nr:amidohydrolase family protein [Hyphomicrobiales bacterium]